MSEVAAGAPAQTPSKKLKILMRSGWGTDDPTRGSFVFAHALAFGWTALLLVAVGLTIGALGSGLTLRRFLRV